MDGMPEWLPDPRIQSCWAPLVPLNKQNICLMCNGYEYECMKFECKNSHISYALGFQDVWLSKCSVTQQQSYFKMMCLKNPEKTFSWALGSYKVYGAGSTPTPFTFGKRESIF